MQGTFESISPLECLSLLYLTVFLFLLLGKERTISLRPHHDHSLKENELYIRTRGN